uniref:Uncharacterized protein LOC111125235 n=1 Tax=Crassostrea virginica TaxID=6565 RepID=A0A8B8D8S3_CRAVI|nr:uncharacterized protein LOC111125235 [Crassostrea virginica]
MKGLSFSEWSDLPLSYHVLQTTSRKPPHRTMILSAILILLTSTTVFSQNHGHQEPTEAQYQQYITELWTASNYDNNDVFSLIELHDVFVHYDTNRDGTITRHEYTNYIGSQVPDLLSFAHALYDIYDANGDHHLGAQDLDVLYKKMDIDGDGTVSKTDFFTFWNQTLHAHAHLHGHGQHLVG